MGNTNPLISIITVVKNGDKYLEECLNSLYKQSYKNYEHIVIDGGSTDKTLEIINRYKDKISFFSSEKDNGIYDGFNKGMKQVTGNYLGFLNSDDILLPNALEILKKNNIVKKISRFYFWISKKTLGSFAWL